MNIDVFKRKIHALNLFTHALLKSERGGIVDCVTWEFCTERFLATGLFTRKRPSKMYLLFEFSAIKIEICVELEFMG